MNFASDLAYLSDNSQEDGHESVDEADLDLSLDGENDLLNDAGSLAEETTRQENRLGDIPAPSTNRGGFGFGSLLSMGFGGGGSGGRGGGGGGSGGRGAGGGGGGGIARRGSSESRKQRSVRLSDDNVSAPNPAPAPAPAPATAAPARRPGAARRYHRKVDTNIMVCSRAYTLASSSSS